MNRDFKGVWIPKEIWLDENLTMLEKVIFVEIDSLDNEEHCTASNDYFAEFCNCSESKVTKAIKKLKELEMIEEISFDGRHRKIRVVKNTRQSSKKYEAESQKVRANNIDNKQKNKTNSKELVKPKENLFSKCVALINDFTEDEQVRLDLNEYLRLLLEMRKDGYTLYANTWKGLLRKLKELSADSAEQHKIVSQSVERGYKSFFPVNDKIYSNTRNKSWERNVRSLNYTSDELAQLDELDQQREAQGMQTRF